MKRLICILLALAVLCPVAFAEDSELTRVTELAKEKLGIGDEYANFSAESMETDGHVIWSMMWDNGDESLSVDMDGEGRVFYYYHIKPSADEILFHYPALSLEEETQTAESFLTTAMASGDGYRIEGSSADLESDERTIYGVITRNGIDTDTTFSISVRTDASGDGYVSFFSRSDSYVKLAETGEAAPIVTYDEANGSLLDFFTLRLVYREDEDGKTARPAYVRASERQFVDAATGDVAEWGEYITYRYNSGKTEAFDAGYGLTEAERQGVADYESALSREELDGIVRSLPHIGSKDMTLSAFSLQWMDNDLAANMDYQDGDRWISVTMNAVTGRMERIWGSTDSAGAQVDAEALRVNAEEFLTACIPDLFGQMELDSTSAEDGNEYAGYEYVRMVNGIPYPANGASVTIDAETGYVQYCAINWTDGMEFAGEPAISAEAARESWLSGLKTDLHYVTFNDCQILAWVWLGNEPAYISAETGEAVFPEETAEQDVPREYADVCGRLTEVGVGFADGELRPDDGMTVREMLRLFASLYGVNTDGDTDEELVTGYPMSLLGLQEDELDRPATVLILAKAVVIRAGFRDAAELPGIYKTEFADGDAIPAESLGYAAIASALNLVPADAEMFQPDRPLTRGEALIMLDGVFSR